MGNRKQAAGRADHACRYRLVKIRFAMAKPVASAVQRTTHRARARGRFEARAKFICSGMMPAIEVVFFDPIFPA
jgi:hypothetical protein